MSLEINNKNVDKNKDNIEPNSRFNQDQTKFKYLLTFVIYFCSIVYGISSFIYASSLIDMKLLMSSSIETMSLVFPIVCISFTAGSLLSGFLFKLLNRHLCCIVSVLLMGLSVALTAHSPNIAFLFSMASTKGITSGIFNTAQVVWIIEIWRDNSPPFIQALQFFISIGSFVTPLMNKPFLNDCLQNDKNNNNFETKINKTQEWIKLSDNHSELDIPFNATQHTCGNDTHIAIPYGINGILAICGSTLLLIMFILIKTNRKFDNLGANVPIFTIGKNKTKGVEHTFFNKDQPKCQQIFYIVCGFVIIGIYFGFEIAAFQLISTFTRFLNENVTGPESAVLMSIFGGCFTLFRGISIMIAIKIRPEIMLLFNLIFSIAGNLIFIFYGETSYTMIIVACALLGTGYSSTLPSLYTFLKGYIHINNSIGSLFSFGGGLMAAINTLVFGKLIKKIPLLLIYANLVYIVILVVFIFIIALYKCYLKNDINKYSAKETVNQSSDKTGQNFNSIEMNDTIAVNCIEING